MSFSEQFKKFRLDRITDPNEALDYLDRHEKSKCLTRHYNSEFFENINKFIEERGWVDIEYQYYKCLTNPTYSPESLNSELKELTNELVGYLNSINIEITPKPSIQNKIFEEIKKEIFVFLNRTSITNTSIIETPNILIRLMKNKNLKTMTKNTKNSLVHFYQTK